MFGIDPAGFKKAQVESAAVQETRLPLREAARVLYLQLSCPKGNWKHW